jgi:hypothetical protein
MTINTVEQAATIVERVAEWVESRLTPARKAQRLLRRAANLRLRAENYTRRARTREARGANGDKLRILAQEARAKADVAENEAFRLRTAEWAESRFGDGR